MGEDNGSENGQRGRMTSRLGRLGQSRRARSDERFAERFTHHWSQMRSERQATAPAATIVDEPSNLSRAQVPWAFDLAAAWSWRLLVVAGAGYVLALAPGEVLGHLLAVGDLVLIAALAAPVVESAHKVRIPRKLASAIVVVGGLAGVVMP
ncbi:MAG: hypothetical protein WKF54_02250 [Nocardioidaceae bacterium]